MSRSTVVYIPRVDDVGKFLVCRAENPDIPGSAIEDKWSPEIYCEYIYIFASFIVQLFVFIHYLNLLNYFL